MNSDSVTTNIGELPIHIGDGNYSGKYPKASEFVLSGVPFISASDFSNGRISPVNFRYISEAQHSTLLKGHIKTGDVLIVTRGNGTGNVAWVDSEFDGCNINAQLVLLRTDEVIIHNRFLYYLFSSKEYKDIFVSYSSGSAQPQLPIRALKHVQLNILPFEFQVEIAKTLSSIDDRIALLRETNATLEAMAQALFKSWFVDFDPVHANAGTQAATLPPELQSLFPATFTETPQGLVPEGWEVLPFTDTINVIGGGTPKTAIPEYWNGDIPWFSVVDAPSINDVFVISTQKQISETGLKNCASKLLPIGTTIISARGTVGRLALVGREMAMNQSCYGLRGKTGGDYFTYFTTYRMVETLKQRSHGSVFDTITRDTLTGVDVIYPAQPVIVAFEDAVGAAMEKIKTNLEQTQTLATLRDTLLPRLISGQLRLPEAEAALAEVD